MSEHKTVKKINRMFDEYKQYIGAIFVEKFGTSYMRFEDTQDNWRSMVRYTPDAEATLLMYTKVYIRNLNHKSLNNLNVLIGQMSEFLAEYVVKKYTKQDDNAIQSVTASIKESLWDKNNYIVKLTQRNLLAQERKKSQEEAKAIAAAKAAAKAAAAALEAEKAEMERKNRTERKRIPLVIHNGIQYKCVRDRSARGR